MISYTAAITPQLYYTESVMFDVYIIACGFTAEAQARGGNEIHLGLALAVGYCLFLLYEILGLGGLLHGLQLLGIVCSFRLKLWASGDSCSSCRVLPVLFV